jgi:hypothetical protein
MASVPDRHPVACRMSAVLLDAQQPCKAPLQAVLVRQIPRRRPIMMHPPLPSPWVLSSPTEPRHGVSPLPPETPSVYSQATHPLQHSPILSPAVRLLSTHISPTEEVHLGHCPACGVSCQLPLQQEDLPIPGKTGRPASQQEAGPPRPPNRSLACRHVPACTAGGTPMQPRP